MKKLLMGTVLFCASMLSADATIMVENITDPVFLVEVGDSNTIYNPVPNANLQTKEHNQFDARSAQSVGILNLKLVYSTTNSKVTPACEFTLQVVQDAQSKLYKVQKVSATPIRTDRSVPI